MGHQTPKSPEPTAATPGSSAVAVRVTSRRWLSYVRPLDHAMKRIILLFVLCGIVSGCGTSSPRWAVSGWVDRKAAAAEARQLQVCAPFSIGPLTGSGWLLDYKDSTNVMIYANGDTTFAYQLNAFTIPLTNSFSSWDSFAAYARDRRLSKKANVQVIEQSFRQTKRFAQTELEYYVKGSLNKEGTNFIFQYRGYDFVHPTSSNLHVNLAYSEFHRNDETNTVRLNQAESWISTFQAK